ncbi:MAG: glyoxalase [Gammaproteobacteria bacterium SG8_30]|nr:MAG: glyoxalase [Gammaproteobacteria bacterium SG8_30]
MKTAKELDYTLHHLCIYDDKPRESIWPYLRWHHGITNFFSGAVFHVTGEGHSDYTFMGCGGRSFQIQIEAPPFQFEYERSWYATHGNAYNHICWVTSDARASHDQLLANGAELVMPFEEFPTYDGFVVKDPEGRWVEIMEYTHDTFRVQEFTHAPSGECGLEMIGAHELCRDLGAMVDWYTRVMGMQVIRSYGDGDDRVVFLSDRLYDPERRNTVFVLSQARTAAEKDGVAQHGPHIASILYQAQDVKRAWDDALWAGMQAIAEPAKDPVTGALTGYLREPVGNMITLRERFQPG